MSACPNCATQVAPGSTSPSFPFCSPRCKLLDLDNWLGGRYVVAQALPFSEESDLALLHDGGDTGEE